MERELVAHPRGMRLGPLTLTLADVAIVAIAIVLILDAAGAIGRL